MKEEYTSWEYFKEDTPINITKNVKLQGDAYIVAKM